MLQIANNDFAYLSFSLEIMDGNHAADNDETPEGNNETPEDNNETEGNDDNLIANNGDNDETEGEDENDHQDAVDADNARQANPSKNIHWDQIQMTNKQQQKAIFLYENDYLFLLQNNVLYAKLLLLVNAGKVI